MHFRYPYTAAVLLTLLLTACGGQPASDVSGTWTGALSSGSNIALELAQSGTSVTGTVTIAGFPATLSGTFASGLLSLTGRDDVGAVSLEARVSATSMEGRYDAVDPATESPISMTFTASK